MSLLITAMMGCNSDPNNETVIESIKPFTIAMIPDTQNMVDYTHQTSFFDSTGAIDESFPMDSAEQFITMMQYISENTINNGGNIAFLASVGDVWQHQSYEIDTEHQDRGHEIATNNVLALNLGDYHNSQTRSFELPKSKEGYDFIRDSGIPFGVAPGNHDSDAMWVDTTIPGVDMFTATGEADLNACVLENIEQRFPAVCFGILHIGGNENFNSIFGAESEYFNDQPWYVGSYHGGASSAQVFSAGGYQFLNINFEMQPSNEVLSWGQSMVDAYPGIPTLITTHDFLDGAAERAGNPIVDLVVADPDNHNSANDVFDKLITKNDQIFMVLSGHHHGKARRTDTNDKGNNVYQILADYQDRGQSYLDAIAENGGNEPDETVGIGDGWFRMMEFDLDREMPVMNVRTYSTHYNTFSNEQTEYTDYYLESERKYSGTVSGDTLTAEQFNEQDDFTIELTDFVKRFGLPNPKYN